MSELLTMALLELRSLWGINRIIHTEDKSRKRTYAALGCVWALLVLMVIFYVGSLVYGLCFLGMSALVPSYLVFLASMLILVFGIFRAGHILFSPKGYDIISSMPIKSTSTVLSRYIVMYFEDTVLSAVIMLVGCAVYGVLVRPNILFYVISFAGMLLIPAIPSVISALFGTLVFAVSSRFKHKSTVQTLLAVGVVVSVLILSFGAGNMDAELTEQMLANIASTAAELIGKIYFPAMLLGYAMLYSDIIGFLWFVLVSAAAVALCIFISSKLFHFVMRALMSTHGRKGYKKSEISSGGIRMALYKREAKRYFSSSIYVTNTIIGPIMGAVISVALCVAGIETVTSSLPAEIPVRMLIPFAVSAVFSMMTTSSVSISMEGRQVEVIKSLPIPAKALFDAKMLLNLSLVLPFFIVSQTALIIALKPSLGELFALVFIPSFIILLSVVFGISVNLKLHRFDWEREEQIVKQSAPSAIGGFAGVILSAVFALPMLLLPSVHTAFVICVVLLALCMLLYNYNSKAKLEQL